MPAQSVKGLAQGGHLGHAGDQHALVFQADEHRPQGNAADETARAVDGINDPAKAGRAGPLAVFLAEKGIVRKLAEQQRAQERFGVAVGGGHRALVGFPFDLNFAGEIALGELRGLPRRIDGSVVAIAPLWVHVDSASD